MEEYLDENALARLSGRKYAQSEASDKISEASGAPREEPEAVDGTGEEVLTKHHKNKTNDLQALRILLVGYCEDTARCQRLRRMQKMVKKH
jgi:hypothetical protein